MSLKSVKSMRPVFEVQAEICRCLAHPVRLEMIELIADSEISNQQLVELLEIPKANVSQHIGILRDAGLVTVRKEGVNNFISLAMPQIKQACAMVRSLLDKRIAMDQSQNKQVQALLSKDKK